MIWTQVMKTAAQAIASDPAPHPYGHYYTDSDLRARAWEFAAVHAGTEFQPHQVEYLQCLIQRLDTRATHTAFKELF